MYKRQELDNVKTGDTLLVYPNRKLVAYVPMSGIPTYTIHPVSYTHLDVYKRQVSRIGVMKHFT